MLAAAQSVAAAVVAAAAAAAATRHVPEALPLRRQMRRLDSQGNGVLLEQLLGVLVH